MEYYLGESGLTISRYSAKESLQAGKSSRMSSTDSRFASTSESKTSSKDNRSRALPSSSTEAVRAIVVAGVWTLVR
jgi:hypothetical protein